MPRYFLEVAYEGSSHSGFQIQKNANTIQGEVNRSLQILLKRPIITYGSSRTDTGVHACQNFLHIDLDRPIPREKLYNLNAILPSSIAIRAIYPVTDEAHARFSAIKRAYKYVLYTRKDPFLKNYGYFFPYPLDMDEMQMAADILLKYRNFESFSKRNTQVNTFLCDIQKAFWRREDHRIIFSVTSNRFLRGMVRGLVATIIKVGRGQLSISAFEQLLKQGRCGSADFSAPAKGLFLEEITYPSYIFL